MKSLCMSSIKINRNLIIDGLILGISTTPLIYIFSGALFGFSTMFSVILLPLYIISLGIILKRRVIGEKLSKVTDQIIELACFLIVIIFIVLISNYNLQTMIERMRYVSLFSFISIVIWWVLLKVISSR